MSRKSSTRGERLINIAGAAMVAVFSIGWFWTVANARLSGDPDAAAAPGALAASFGGTRVPMTAYVTDALVSRFGESERDSGSVGGRVGMGRGSSTANEVAHVASKISETVRGLVNFEGMHFIPLAARQNGRVGTYRVGRWPTEGRKAVRTNYEPPPGFIEVTRENFDQPVSDHFKLGDFTTHDQQDVWPKYVVVQARIIQKLEYTIEELEKMGHPVRHITVMSGFRTPQYNAGGGNTGGRAGLSRHMYGDASDVFIDNDGNGTMDDLNGDGRVDINDARVVLEAVNRVEAAHPELIGGVGVYVANSGHGPFTHIDARGYRARWTGTGSG